ARGRRRVAYVYEKPDTSTFRYRVYNMIECLKASPSKISATYFSFDELEALFSILDSLDVLVVCRCRYSDKLNRLITTARFKGKPVFFDIDDFVFDTSYAHMILQTLDQDLSHPNVWDHWFAYIGRLGAAMRICDRVITTNEFLSSLAQKFSQKPVSVIPN